jgi:hypothetical protein
MKGNWAFKGKVLEFFDRVDWKQDKLEYLDQIYSRSLKTLKDQGLTPPLIETLETLYQITQTRAENRAAAADELRAQQQTFKAQLNEVQRDFQAKLHLRQRDFEAQLQQFETKLQQQQLDFLAQLQLQPRQVESQLQTVLYSVNQLSIQEQGFIYNFYPYTSRLHKTNLSTGQERSTTLNHTFKFGSSLCESTEGNLFITGGMPATRKLVCIDPTTKAVTPKPIMKTARWGHGSVFYGGLLYVIGGYNGALLAECERYDTLHNHWQPIPPLPHASRYHAAIVCGYTRRIYILGGNDGLYLDLIQEFELESQSWKLLEVKLPSKSNFIPCFNLKNQALIYFIQGGALHSFSPITYALANVKPVTNITSYHGPSYFAKGTLYYPDASGPVLKLVIGNLS